MPTKKQTYTNISPNNAMKKLKVLIITNGWPPSSDGGVQRWLILSKYLLEQDIQPIIFTEDKKEHKLYDSSLEKEVHASLIVWKKRRSFQPIVFLRRILNPFRKFQSIRNIQDSLQSYTPHKKMSVTERLLRWGRKFFIPDIGILFVRQSKRFLLRRIKKENITHCITTGPPHSMHLLGLALKKRISTLKWVADFRDPWSKWCVLDTMGFSARGKRKMAAMEQKVMKHCNLLLTVSQQWEKDFQQLGAQHTQTICNGFDPQYIQRVQRKNTSPSKKAFIIIHLGQLNLARAQAFLQALEEGIQTQAPWTKNLQWYLGGEVEKRLQQYTRERLANHVRYIGYVPHESLFNYYYQAHLLLLFCHPSQEATAGQIPGKLFEYLCVGRQALLMGEENGDADRILREAKIGYAVRWNDPKAIQKALEKAYETRQKQPDPIDMENNPYNRKNQSKQLADWLKNL